MNEEIWRAIQAHDAAWDGRFYYGLKSTRTVCRPSCTARIARAQDVVVFDTLEEARCAGYRLCSRCRPDLPAWQGVKPELAERAADYIRAHYTEKFSLDALAAALYVDKIYLSKTFKEIKGVTLLKYHNQTRCDQAAALLRSSQLSMELIGAQVGFATASHFARTFKTFYGCAPKEYRKRHLAALENNLP